MADISEHPHYRALSRRLRAVSDDLAREWNSPVFRCVELKWARSEFLVSGEGTIKHGGRWMRRGVTPVVHASSSESIALKESWNTVAYYGINRPRNNPRVIVEIDVRLEYVADLTRIERVISWPSVGELLDEEWEKINAGGSETLSQAVGRVLFGIGFEALVVPSARDRQGRNLAWFPQNLRSESRVRISGENELDNWLAK